MPDKIRCRRAKVRELLKNSNVPYSVKKYWISEARKITPKCKWKIEGLLELPPRDIQEYEIEVYEEEIGYDRLVGIDQKALLEQLEIGMEVIHVSYQPQRVAIIVDFDMDRVVLKYDDDVKYWANVCFVSPVVLDER